jgi:hypothetical protein
MVAEVSVAVRAALAADDHQARSTGFVSLMRKSERLEAGASTRSRAQWERAVIVSPSSPRG